MSEIAITLRDDVYEALCRAAKERGVSVDELAREAIENVAAWAPPRGGRPKPHLGIVESKGPPIDWSRPLWDQELPDSKS